MGSILDALSRSAASSGQRVVEWLPQLLEAAVLLVVGWVLARLLRLVARRATALVDSLIATTTRKSRWGVAHLASLLGTVAYWGVLLFFIAAATHALGLQTFTDWLARLLDHLPNVAAGILIVVIGYVLSGLAAQLVEATASGLAPVQRAALARVAQGATLIVAVLVGADQIGLKVTWIAVLASVLLASVMGGVTLAASLGARGYVANLIGAHYLRQAFQAGQHVRVAGVQGRIVEVTATSLVLETADGLVLMPGRVYHEEAILVVAAPATR